MRYIRSCQLPTKTVNNPNIHPYNILKDKGGESLIFDSITMLYGNNGSGKSTLLNLLATKLNLPGAEKPKVWGKTDYHDDYANHMVISFEEDEETGDLRHIPENSYYIKSEDVLYEIKKIQQEAILREGYRYQRKQLGVTKENSKVTDGDARETEAIAKLLFSQEKYSNGQTAMQVFQDYLIPDALYFLDEPEVSLSPKNQLILAGMITEAARFLNCQFVIATHSPFILGSLEGTIYNLNLPGLTSQNWKNLPEMRLYFDFFS